MTEIKKEVKVYKIHLMCDVCKIGELFPTGVQLTSLPAQYMHKCNNCGDEKSITGKVYPQIEYE